MVNSDLGDAVRLFWNVGEVAGSDTFTRLLTRQADGSLVAEVRVPQGQTVQATIGFELPTEVTADMNGAAESTALDFLVRVRLQGETAAPELPKLAVTGAQVLGLLALGLGLLGLGLLLRALVRRRRPACDDCGHRIVRGERWSEHHAEDGTRHVQCETCAGQASGPRDAAEGHRLAPHTAGAPASSDRLDAEPTGTHPDLSADQCSQSGVLTR